MLGPMYNFFILSIHIALIGTLSVVALRLSKELLTLMLCLLALSMNLFVFKQITLFGLHVTASDALAVGYLLGLNFMQEYYGAKETRKVVGISFLAAGTFALLGQIHLAYHPSPYDLAQTHFDFLFRPAPRIFLASLTSFLLVQLLDIQFFKFLRRKTEGSFFPFRVALCITLSQGLDTLIFSFLGLYGHVAHIWQVILFSLAAKLLCTALSIPFTYFTKKRDCHAV